MDENASSWEMGNRLNFSRMRLIIGMNNMNTLCRLFYYINLLLRFNLYFHLLLYFDFEF